MGAKTGQTILYLYFKTGGGHFFSAKALAKAVEEAYPDTRNVLVDGLPPKAGFWRTLLEEGYRFAVQDWPFLWPMLYELSKLRPLRFLQLLNVRSVCQSYLERQIQELGATKLVVLHFLLVRPAVRAVQRLGLDLPVLEVVTDPFTTHPFWWHHRGGVRAAVFSQRAYQDALRHGWRPEDLKQFPIMLRPEFAGPLEPAKVATLRQRFQTGDLPVVLFAGGGDGLPDAEALLKECQRADIPARFLIVCGKNEKQKAALERLLPELGGFGERVTVFGFVDFMYELMNVADVIVTKGGPATIMEILLIGKPPLVNSYIYGQEQGNVDFLLEHQVGAYIPNPRRMAAELKRLVENPHALDAMRERIQALNLRNGTQEVARWVYEA